MKNIRRYKYVGPHEIQAQVASGPKGHTIACIGDLFDWMRSTNIGHSGELTVTFIINLNGDLCVADWRSEHVACAGGKNVLAAGEMTFEYDRESIRIEAVTNQSTGYCPEPESWTAVETALNQIGIVHPGKYTTAMIFRRCESCGQKNLVKDEWFYCLVCNGELPLSWNFS